jgi:fluoride ion exporter CrcB/FEX
VVVSIGIIRYKTGMILRDDQTLSYVYWGIFTMVVFYGVFQFKKRDPSSFSYSRTMKIGLLAGLISGLMYTVYIVVLNSYLDPELAAKIITFKNLNHSGMATQDLSDSTKIMEMNETLRGLVYTLVCMTFGIIHSLLGTLAAKKLNYKPQ